MTPPLRIAYAGTPQFAVPALLALIDSPHRVVGVLTQPDRPKGRGQQLTPSPVKQAALARGLPVAQPLTLKTPEGRAALLEWQPDALVVVAYGLLLPQAVLELPRLGCINIHASLLPRWRGAAPIQRAILAGDDVTGVSLMQMDAGLDTGPILLQRSLAITAQHTSGTLHDELAELGANVLVDTLQQLASASLQPRAQPATGVTYAYKIDKAEALIDWTRSAEAIGRQVRAFNPWPIAETRFAGEQLRIHVAQALSDADISRIKPDVDAYTPGMIVACVDSHVWVRCGTGVLAIRQLQRPGRKPVSARDFCNTVQWQGRQLG